MSTCLTTRPRPPRSHAKRADAFTLIELLTVIAIIGILAAIVIPVVGKVRKTAQGARCVSNLRQVGTAMMAFTSDNKGKLFTKVFDLQSSSYDGDPRRIQSRLYPYLNVPKEEWGPQKVAEIMRCESWYSLWPAAFATIGPSLWLNGTEHTGRGVRVGGQLIAPFGPANPSLDASKPVGLSLGSIDSPSREWAMVETDALLSRLQISAHKANVPQELVHGNYRNALFFDGHVAKLDMTTNEPL